MNKMFLATFLTLAILTGAQAAPEKGYFGFKLGAETTGFPLNPTVKRVVIKSVVPDSPAAGHLEVGDEIIEAEGHAVPGAKALQLKPIMQKSPGETVHLKLKRANGESYSVNLTAVKRPA
ncbi:MAG: PDZ domain-containing protein [Chthoniobacterales bacterium]